MRTLIIIATLLFCVSVAFSVSAAESALPKSAPPVRILMQWVPQSQFAGYIMAVEKKLFAKHGVENVQIEFSRVADVPMTKLTNGDCEYATGWLATAIQRRAEGLPIINVAQFHRRSAAMIVAHKSHGIEKPADLSGKVILSWGGDFDVEMTLFFRKYQITPKAVLPFLSSLAPFLKGVVDAVQVVEYNEYCRLIELGMEEQDMAVFHFEEHGIGAVGDGLYATEERSREHPDQVRAIRLAVTEGWEYAFRNQQETVDTVMKYSAKHGERTNPFHQQQMLDTIKKLMEFDSNQDYHQFGVLRYQDFAHAKLLLQRSGYNVDSITYENFYIP